MSSGRAGTRRTRPNDPHRRERIARAAIAVVAERGLEGLTHRAVAAAAEVPLGSTTYHFATLDDLLEVALAHAAEDNIARMRAWEAALAPGADVAVAITDLVMDGVRAQRPATVVEYELYLAALHRPRLRPLSSGWDDALAELFTARTDPSTGRLLATLYCGAVMQTAVADPQPTRDDVLALFRRAVGGHPPG
jgi:TetR/AcrR family transcriptional regulator, regulator of biofilm formation and stress response